MSAVTFSLKLEKKGDVYPFRLAVGTEAVDDVFKWDFDPASHEWQIVDKIQQNDGTIDDLKYLGTLLWTRLFSGTAGALFARKSLEGRKAGAPIHLRLRFERGDLERLPWEALFDESTSRFVAADAGISVIREPMLPGPRVQPVPGEKEQLRVAVVIPQGSGLSVEREWKMLEAATSGLGNRIRLERIEDRVTPTSLRARIHAQAWDIVHFIGHGQETDDKVEIRLNADDGGDFWMSALPFASLFTDSGVQLVVLNCCWAGAVLESATGSLSGVGPYLIHRGIPATIAMRYEIRDSVAARFSEAFYRALVAGDAPGRIDAALEMARLTVYLNQRESDARGFVTPALYLAEGCEQLFTFPSRKPTPIVLASPAPVRSSVLPADLVRALEKHRCIPVLGHGILRHGLTRDSGPSSVPDASGLARLLATVYEYPQKEDFELCEKGGEWMDQQLLEWVCQNYVAENGRSELYDRIDEAFIQWRQTAEVDGLMSELATWDVPGIIYTYFDGLLERMISDRNHKQPTQVLFDLEQAPADRDMRMLVLLRGTRSAKESLVLTEDDRDKLWDRIGRLNSQIVERAQRPSHSLLFIGLSPRDPLVRRLSKQLLVAGSPSPKDRSQGPTFFACGSHTRIDDAYWRKFDIQWIDSDLDVLIREVTKVCK